MMRQADTLFARLFGIFLAAIVLAHLLAFLWFQQYGNPPPPQPMPPHATDGPRAGQPPPPRPLFGGPLVPLTFQLLTLIVAAWYGARVLSRPIQRLASAADRLSENLQAPPLDERGPREVRQAAHAFNLMQQRIREQVAQRSRMLAAVSHDLRTPIARVKLRVEQVPDAQLRSRMDQDLGEMVAMLDATLNYLHQQRADEALQLFDLQALVESMAEDAQDRGADVRAEGQCAPLRAQPMALRSCVSNLVENALRYAGHARVRLEDGPTEVRIHVSDRGPGIAPEQREAVFEPFFRLEGSRNRSSGGVGLGLTIAREAARRQGGDLVLGDNPGGGLLATLTIPRA
ncbi:ATP-binding protein [Pseudomonas solani]|uniref:ATP-binding protein n=1 Tax=Pseudomonas TaxID=286 RepID=UPI0029281460|nr:ATP-binding protein [Pseudomonas sp. zfem005]MDU9416584.1 ATP-binding protein [Pseudomonas sp. zfem005]